MTPDQAALLSSELKGLNKGLTRQFDNLEQTVKTGFAEFHEDQKRQDKKIDGILLREQREEGRRQSISAVKVFLMGFLITAINSGIAVGVVKALG